MSASAWDLPLPTGEEVCTCTSCFEESSSDVRGTSGWLVLRRLNGITLAICRSCIAETEPPRRNRS